MGPAVPRARRAGARSRSRASLLPPAPERLAGRPAWWFHPLGIEAKRARALTEVARIADRLWDWVARPRDELVGAARAGPGHRSVDDRLGARAGVRRRRRRAGRRLPHPQPRRLQPGRRTAGRRCPYALAPRTVPRRSRSGASGCWAGPGGAHRRTAHDAASFPCTDGDDHASLRHPVRRPVDPMPRSAATVAAVGHVARADRGERRARHGAGNGNGHGGAVPRHDDAAPSPVILTEGRTWRRAVAIGIAAFIVSRLCMLAGAGVRAAQVTVDAHDNLEPVPGHARGRWSTGCSRSGTASGTWRSSATATRRSIPPNVTYFQLEARAAFFPLFPMVARVFDWILPGGDTLAALGLNVLLAVAGMIVVGHLARRLYDNDVAERAMVLFAVFPGSFVLSYAYAEALLILLAALCLWFLLDERWLLAGAGRGAGDGDAPERHRPRRRLRSWPRSSPSSKRRDWWSLIAPLLAPVGFVAFQLFLVRPHRRVGVVPRPARGVARGHQLRRHGDQQHAELLHPPAGLADRRPHGRLDGRARCSGCGACGASGCRGRWSPTSRSSCC